MGVRRTVGFGPAVPDGRLDSLNFPYLTQLVVAVELIHPSAYSEAADAAAEVDPLDLEYTVLEPLDSRLI